MNLFNRDYLKQQMSEKILKAEKKDRMHSEDYLINKKLLKKFAIVNK